MCTGAREEVRRLMSVLLQRESKYSHEIRNTDFYLTSATRERERERGVTNEFVSQLWDVWDGPDFYTKSFVFGLIRLLEN